MLQLHLDDWFGDFNGVFNFLGEVFLSEYLQYIRGLNYKSFAGLVNYLDPHLPQKSNLPLEHACVTLPFWPPKTTRKITESGFTCEPWKTRPIPYQIQWNSGWFRDFIREEFYSPESRGRIQNPQENSNNQTSVSPQVPCATKLTILNSDHRTCVPFRLWRLKKNTEFHKLCKFQI